MTLLLPTFSSLLHDLYLLAAVPSSASVVCPLSPAPCIPHTNSEWSNASLFSSCVMYLLAALFSTCRKHLTAALENLDSGRFCLSVMGEFNAGKVRVRLTTVYNVHNIQHVARHSAFRTEIHQTY